VDGSAIGSPALPPAVAEEMEGAGVAGSDFLPEFGFSGWEGVT